MYEIGKSFSEIFVMSDPHHVKIIPNFSKASIGYFRGVTATFSPVPFFETKITWKQAAPPGLCSPALAQGRLNILGPKRVRDASAPQPPGEEAQMKRRRHVVGEWLVKIVGPAQPQRGRVQVTVENVDQRDRRFAQALAKVVEVWIASGRRRPA